MKSIDFYGFCRKLFPEHYLSQSFDLVVVKCLEEEDGKDAYQADYLMVCDETFVKAINIRHLQERLFEARACLGEEVRVRVAFTDTEEIFEWSYGNLKENYLLSEEMLRRKPLQEKFLQAIKIKEEVIDSLVEKNPGLMAETEQGKVVNFSLPVFQKMMAEKQVNTAKCDLSAGANTIFASGVEQVELLTATGFLEQRTSKKDLLCMCLEEIRKKELKRKRDINRKRHYF